jgi:hypothetical protein
MNDRDAIMSDFLFARPSFIEGVARLADLGNALNSYNVSRTGGQADARALDRDWRALAHDLRVALRELQADPQP